MNKFRRWYQGGPELDREIEMRFGDLVERAIEGELASWSEKPRGRLARVVLLDQLARNLHRGTARAYAGDQRALELALEMLDRNDVAAFTLEERLFVVMPLVHSEDLRIQERAVALAQQMIEDSPPELRPAWSLGAGRTAYYRDVVARFGRFPHRNVVLGRKSSTDELAFLEAEAVRPAPLAAG